ncbi:MAG: thrombospondin type 3 repeat-containing protein [Pseudomonadota bacterium]
MTGPDAGSVAGVLVQSLRLMRDYENAFIERSSDGRFSLRGSFPSAGTRADCDRTGTVFNKISENRETRTVTYENCGTFIPEGLAALTGEIQIFVKEGRNEVSRVTFRNLEISAANFTRRISGTLVVNGPANLLTLDATIDDSVSGRISADDLRIGYESRDLFTGALMSIEKASGRISHNAVGRLHLSVAKKSKLRLRDRKGTMLTLEFTRAGQFVEFYPKKGKKMKRSLFIDRDSFTEYRFMSRSASGRPIRLTSFVGDMVPPLINQRETIIIDPREKFTDYGGHLLKYDIRLESASRASSFRPLEQGERLENSDPSIDVQMKDIGGGRWKFSSNTPGKAINYEFSVGVKDYRGKRAADRFSFTFTVKGDFDNDGVLDVDDDDIDNDGIPNWQDDLDYNAGETVDTDGDGIGDRNDSDRDGDGVVDAEDSYPKDPVCSAPGSGLGDRCYETRILQGNRIHYALDHRAVVHFVSDINFKMIRYDIPNRRYLPFVDITPENTGARADEIYTQAGHTRIVVRYTDGSTREFEASPSQESPMANRDSEAPSLFHSDLGMSDRSLGIGGEGVSPTGEYVVSAGDLYYLGPPHQRIVDNEAVQDHQYRWLSNTRFLLLLDRMEALSLTVNDIIHDSKLGHTEDRVETVKIWEFHDGLGGIYNSERRAQEELDGKSGYARLWRRGNKVYFIEVQSVHSDIPGGNRQDTLIFHEISIGKFLPK